MAYGCKFCKMNKNHEEYCAITGQKTNGAVLCDFEFDLHCELYAKAVKRKQESKAKPAAHRSCAKYVQTSIFGAAGEKLVN